MFRWITQGLYRWWLRRQQGWRQRRLRVTEQHRWHGEYHVRYSTAPGGLSVCDRPPASSAASSHYHHYGESEAHQSPKCTEKHTFISVPEFRPRGTVNDLIWVRTPSVTQCRTRFYLAWKFLCISFVSGRTHTKKPPQKTPDATLIINLYPKFP